MQLALVLLAVFVFAGLLSVCSGARQGLGEIKSMYYGTGRMMTRSNMTDAECAKRKDCSSCTDSSHCVWCSVDSYCRTGSFSGADCDGWMFGQCANDGLALLVGVGIIIALAILILAAIIFCFIFCRRSTASYEVMDDEAPSDNTSKAAHPITDQHRADMEAKYNLSSTQPRAEIDT